jgi:hypothetical protein
VQARDISVETKSFLGVLSDYYRTPRKKVTGLFPLKKASSGAVERVDMPETSEQLPFE